MYRWKYENGTILPVLKLKMVNNRAKIYPDPLLSITSDYELRLFEMRHQINWNQ